MTSNVYEIKCKTEGCGVTGQDNFYVNRRTCKQCLIKKSKERYKSLYTPENKSIACIKCHVLKDRSFFSVSKKTSLCKEICNQCRCPTDLLQVPPQFNEIKFKQYVEWFKTQQALIDKEGIEILKYIVANLNIY